MHKGRASDPTVQDQSGLQPASLNAQLPASAANLGSGANSFTTVLTTNSLPATVAANITIFLQHLFGERAAMHTRTCLPATCF